MGRYASFNGNEDNQELSYKFWFGIQNSVIPWGNNYIEYFIPEFDEDVAADMDEATVQFWKDNQDSGYDEKFFQDKNMTSFMEEYCDPQYYANDDDSNLENYWVEVDKVIQDLEAPAFDREDTEGIVSRAEQYWDLLWKTYNTHEKAESYADLSLKVLVCSMLAEWGSYSCSFEV